MIQDLMKPLAGSDNPGLQRLLRPNAMNLDLLFEAIVAMTNDFSTGLRVNTEALRDQMSASVGRGQTTITLFNDNATIIVTHINSSVSEIKIVIKEKDNVTITSNQILEDDGKKIVGRLQEFERQKTQKVHAVEQDKLNSIFKQIIPSNQG